MDAIFLDTSAFLKLYLPEKGTGWLKSFVSGKQAIISELALVESAMTLGRLYREGIYTRNQASKLYVQIYQERFKYDIITLGTEHLLNKAISLAFRVPATLRLRTLDGIHLATAINAFTRANSQTPAVPFTFLSADTKLLNVAHFQGFVIENPENHP